MIVLTGVSVTTAVLVNFAPATSYALREVTEFL
jgi:hypothetical protein